MKKKVKPIKADEDEPEPDDADEELAHSAPLKGENSDEDELEPEDADEDDADEDEEDAEPSVAHSAPLKGVVPQAHVDEEMDKWQANQALLEKLEEGQRRIERRLNKLVHPAKPKPFPSPTNPPKTVKHQTIKARRLLGRLLKSKPQP